MKWTTAFAHSCTTRRPSFLPLLTAMALVTGTATSTAAAGTSREPGPGTVGQSTLQPAGQRIAFTKSAGNALHDLFVIESGGQGLRNLTNTSGQSEGVPAWSPDASEMTPGPRYIALGDSYASGQGTGAYEDRACFRSGASHPHLLAAAQGMEESFTDVTCGGAALADLTHARAVGVRPQLDALRASAPEIVTLTIGGNDLGDLLVGPDARGGIGGVLASCFVEVSCQTKLTPLEDASRALTDRLTASYEELAVMVPPPSTIYVIGYPQIFPGRDEYRTCFRDMPHPPRDIPVADWIPGSLRYYGWDSDEIAWLGTAVETLNASVRNAVDRVAASAGAAKARVVFVDVSQAFAGSPLCAPRTGRGDRPVRGLLLDASKLSLTIDDLRALYAGLPNFAQGNRSGLFDYLSRIVAPESFHPTIEGQRRIATCAIGRINAFQRDGGPMDGGTCPSGELQPS